jgi:hypothetical protein
MARFAGLVGFGVSTETSPGVFEDVITEKTYFGDVRRAARQANSGDQINDELVVENTIEIVADSYASDNIFAIRYVEWAGTKWKVPNVEVQGVRLLLRLGSVYHD